MYYFRKIAQLACITLALTLTIQCSKEGFGSASDGSAGGSEGKGGSLARFTISGNYLYTVDKAKLRIFDIKSPEAPVFVHTIEIGFNVETIFVLNNTLFIGAQSAMYMYDISIATSPQHITTYNHIYSCDPVVANRQYAFVTLSTTSFCGRNTNALHIIDISNFQNISLLKAYPMVNPKGLGLNDKILYVCDNGTLKVFDISNINDIKLLQSINNGAYDVIPLEHTLIAIGTEGLRQYGYNGGILELLSNINVSNN